MALDATKLFKVGGAAPALFIYHAGSDTASTVTGSGYFNGATDLLKKGDVILVVGNSFASVDVTTVTSNDGAATVTTTAVEGITAT